VDQIRVNSWTKFVGKDIFRFVTTISFLSPYIEVEGNKIIMTSKNIKGDKNESVCKTNASRFHGKYG